MSWSFSVKKKVQTKSTSQKKLKGKEIFEWTQMPQTHCDDGSIFALQDENHKVSPVLPGDRMRVRE